MFMKSQKKGFCPEFASCQAVRKVALRFMVFCSSYTHLFTVHRHNEGEKAKNYLAGLLMKAPRKNMERIDEYVEGSDYESCQHFISGSPWDHIALNNQICSDVNSILGSTESVLCLDESAFTKKGKESVGVSRQWNGRLGKIDNCQVGVFASLCNDYGNSSIIDYRLFLPQKWIDDPKRCDKTRIPEEHRIFKTKLELALDMVDSAISRNVQFGWIAADAFYGRDSKLLNILDDRSLTFVADIPCNHNVYLSDPKPYLPRRKNKIGPKHTTLRTHIDPIKVDTIFNQLTKNQWSGITIRETTKGHLKTNAYRVRVYVWDGIEKKAREWWLVILHDPKTKEKKWFLSNAGNSVTLKMLVRKHACRYWIERTFQDGKTSVGMADYQVRGWRAWQHHMSMVMMALLFMLRERIVNKKELDILSCQDIVDLLNHYLPRKDRTEEAVLKNMLERHRRRKQATKSAFRRQAIEESIIPK